MNLDRLKSDQASLQAHNSSQESLTALVATFRDSRPALSAAMRRHLAGLGLQVSGPDHILWHEGIIGYVEVPASNRSVKIDVWEKLTFDEKRRRSVFRNVRGDEVGDQLVVPQTPMALPVEITASSGRKFSIWWHGPGDNERLTAIVVDVFKGNKGPDELGLRKCFVATVIFGERSEEVAILRQWRDEGLAESPAGRAFVSAYYRWGPYCAAVVEGNAVIRRLAREVLLAACHWLSRHHNSIRPNQRLQPTARVSSSERSKARARRG